MKKIILIKTVLASGIGLAMTQLQAVPTTRIIGGVESAPDTYSWIVSLRRSGGPICGASLVAKKWVMTAAHCVEGGETNNLSVMVGDYNTQKEDKGEQERKISRIIIHPKRQSSSNDHDIALLELASEVNSKAIIPINSEIMSKVKAGTVLTVLGWGNKSTTGEEFPNTLHEVQVPVISNKDCSASYGGDITENMVCAGLKKGGKDSCKGDSGGPLVYQRDGQWHQVGIVSFGAGCAQPDSPGVYARVEKYTDWVTKQVSGVENPNPDPDPDPNDQGREATVSSLFNLPSYVELLSNDGKPEQAKIILENITSKAIEIQSVSVNHASFKIDKNECNKTLKSDSKCQVLVTYTPEKDYEYSDGSLVIDLADGTNVSLDLYGTNLKGVGDTNEPENNNEPIENDDVNWFTDGFEWSPDNEGFVCDNPSLNINDIASLSAEIESDGGDFDFDFDFDFENDFTENDIKYYVDGKLVRTLSGSRKSTVHHSTKLSKGKHRISWVYKKKADGGKVRIENIKLSKAAPSTNTTPSTNSATTPTHNLAASGGGSSDLFFLSALMLLVGGARRLFKKSSNH